MLRIYAVCNKTLVILRECTCAGVRIRVVGVRGYHRLIMDERGEARGQKSFGDRDGDREGTERVF